MRILLNLIIARSEGCGATQISLNFLRATLKDDEIEWIYLLSDEFYGLVKSEMSHIASDHIYVYPRQPKLASYNMVQKAIYKIEEEQKPDVVYTVLAPSYFKFRTPEVMRCCNAWEVIERSNPAFKTLDLKTICFFTLKNFLVRKLMKRAYGFVTQTETAKKGIVRVTKVSSDKVAVVPNVLPKIFRDIEVAKVPHEGIRIVYLASPAPHKNIESIPYLAHVLKEKYKHDNLKFIITVPEKYVKELNYIYSEAEKYNVRDCIENVGSQSQKQLIELYQGCDIGYFPSQLETFSATLLEYMKFSLPIVASDFSFNKDVAGDSALYFDYRNIDEAARIIDSLICDGQLMRKMQELECERLRLYYNYNDHYHGIVSFLKKIGSKNV